MLKLGKDYVFFDLLESQADVAREAARAFHELARDFGNIDRHAKNIADIEHRGDLLTQDLQNRIVSTFITPLDKEDLRDLSQALDDIIDYIEAAAARAELYRIREVRPDLVPLTGLLVQAADLVKEAVVELRQGIHRSGSIRQKLNEIHRVENESDVAFRTALAGLFDEPGIDPLQLIKWKEIYDRIETAVDKCEDIAKIVGTIVVKYA